MFLAKCLSAAEGFLSLGMPEEAEEELARVAEAGALDETYWRLAVAVAMARKQWMEGVERARQLIKMNPSGPDGYLHLAFCLHELGQTREARDALTQGPPRLKTTPIYFYNLACYEAQLGNVAEARTVLERAIRLEPAYREIAEKDPDLDPLR
ncbi:MAG: hypothetical protein OHK005_02850 [Candidatus Methylacidiphilales bacterium]